MTAQVAPRARLRVVDAFAEAAVGITSQPARSALTALGTIVGVAAFVATTGIAATAQAQVGARFDALKATEVRVEDTRPDGTDPFPADTDTRLTRLNGVVAAGLLWRVEADDLAPRRFAANDRRDRPTGVSVVAATAGGLAATRPTLAGGRLFDAGHDGRADHVAVLGPDAARRLVIDRIDRQPVVFIADTAYTVIGILDDVARRPDLLAAVVIPDNTARTHFSPANAQVEVLIEVRPGAAQLIGTQAAVALLPTDPSRLHVTAPPDPRTLRQGVERDVTRLFFGLAAVALAVGTIAIANATLVAVLERRAEIGVRRALGARPVHIAAQFLAETAALGTLGGVTGTALGVIAAAAVAAANHWTTTLDPAYVVAAPFLGTLTGLVAGLFPARRAARTDPAVALRE